MNLIFGDEERQKQAHSRTPVADIELDAQLLDLDAGTPAVPRSTLLACVAELAPVAQQGVSRNSLEHRLIGRASRSKACTSASCLQGS